MTATSEYLERTPRTLEQIVNDPHVSTERRLIAWRELCERLDTLPDNWYIPRSAYDAHSNHSERTWIRLCEYVNRPRALRVLG